MSAPGADRVDVQVLAAEGASFERRYRLEGFARLADALAGPDGEAIGRFRFFEAEEGLPGCELEVEAQVSLRCQRCLEPYRQALRSATRVAFVYDEAGERRVPADCEAVLLASRQASLADLVEDELLLALPVVALHGEGTACAGTREGAGTDTAKAERAGRETHRPFAGLKELLKT